MIESKYITFEREPFFEIAKKYIKPNSAVLDVGAGNGSFSNYCGRKDFYLFDGNSKTVEVLKNEHEKVVLGNLPVLPFKANFFNVIHCSHVIEHLEPTVLYETIKEMDRCLRTDGYLIISAPLLWEGFFSDLSHIRPYNPRVFINYLCENKSNWRTRQKISSNYSVIELVHRYKEVEIAERIVNTNNDYFVSLFLKTISLMKKRGLKRYEKTGFTLVLKK